jgi:hypothetical protein
LEWPIESPKRNPKSMYPLHKGQHPMPRTGL